jgi:hypothetical protein
LPETQLQLPIRWEDRFFLYEAGLKDTDYWKRHIDENIAWYFGNRFVKRWWRAAGVPVVEEEFAHWPSPEFLVQIESGKKPTEEI